MSCAQSPQATYQDRADRYLVKDSTIREHFEIRADGIATYGESRDSLEFFMRWEEVPDFVRMVREFPHEFALQRYLEKGDRNLSVFFPDGFPPSPARPAPDPERPLAGKRICLDPGHMGGTMEFAEMERKFVKIRADEAKDIPEDISFNEGNLALATAILLKDKFEAAGAEVRITRSGEGLSSFGKTFDGKLYEWGKAYSIRHKTPMPDGPMEEHLDYFIKAAADNYIREENITGKDSTWWMTKAKLIHVYKVPFLKAEFRHRAWQINDFRPDLTLIIHYNVHEKNEPEADGYRAAVEDNYCMAFVPGSFMKGELGDPEDRMIFLYKLLSEDIPASIALSDAVIQKHISGLDVPVMEWDPDLRYLAKASMKTEATGVFARNLSLTRLVHGPLCFGESLYQDNVEECVRLNRKDWTAEGMHTPVPNRIREVAKAYYEGVMDYFESSAK